MTGATANDARAGLAEERRLAEDASRQRNWRRWGTYLPERQWGTPREDYSADGDVWRSFPFDDAHLRAYRWGEDGLLGWCDRECRLCFAVALWNGRDDRLKERLFGLTNHEGNHGEDVKERYYYLDAAPTYTYCRGLYQYPQAAFPYRRLREENGRRGRDAPEFEIEDTGVFDGGRFFDVCIEYAKADPDDLFFRLTILNRGPEPAPLHILPTVWFRNTWIWGCEHEGCTLKPHMARSAAGGLSLHHETLGDLAFDMLEDSAAGDPCWLFTENESNAGRLWGVSGYTRFTKDAFHARVVEGRADAVNPRHVGTKAAAWYERLIPPGQPVVLRARLRPVTRAGAARDATFTSAGFDAVMAQRRAETDAYYEPRLSTVADPEARRVVRQAWAGLLWSAQFYHYSVRDWLHGDRAIAVPPPGHETVRNSDWTNFFSRDVLLMPDKWEYPWFAAWDLGFHAVAHARLDTALARRQLILLLREWFMHPSGQIPAYEFSFDDVNPPVHAWACLRVYEMGSPDDEANRLFLERVFQKLLLNFTWWVNRKDVGGRNLFGGGFLGLDNVGVFDRSRPLPDGMQLQQADGTAWVAFYCASMLRIALELARRDAAYEDVASKFFEHFLGIADAINTAGGSGLWDEQDGFYYDRLLRGGDNVPLRVRAITGLIPLCAVAVLDSQALAHHAAFQRRMEWFLSYRSDLSGRISMLTCATDGSTRRLLALPSRPRLLRLLSRLLDPQEFLSPYGVRSLSRHHLAHPFVFPWQDERHEVHYEPAEARQPNFGGNSNWRGPVWVPLNLLLIEALEQYARFFGPSLTVECPTGSGQAMDLWQVASHLRRGLIALFLPGPDGRRPCLGGGEVRDRDLLLFHEYFDGETGRGLGASHQTGWTALVAESILAACRT